MQKKITKERAWVYLYVKKSLTGITDCYLPLENPARVLNLLFCFPYYRTTRTNYFFVTCRDLFFFGLLVNTAAFLLFPIWKMVFPEITDLLFFVISAEEANASRCLISSHALSSFPLFFMCTSANSPFNFFPLRRNFNDPAFNWPRSDFSISFL